MLQPREKCEHNDGSEWHTFGASPTKGDLPIGLLVSAYLIDVEQTVCDEVLVDRELPRAENLTLQA